jgi:sarcosine oxidase subunit gamma
MVGVAPSSPFSGLRADAAGAGLRISDRSGLGVALISMRQGRRADLAERMATQFNIVLPHGDWMTIGENLALIGTGAGSGLALKEDPPPAWTEAMAAALGDCASVVDHSGDYGILRLQGPALGPVLAKGAKLDLTAFKVHQTAATVVRRVNVTLWRLDEETFEVAAPRNRARELWRWLESSAADYGLTWD